MASLNYLWRNRAKFRFASLNFFKAWAKRIVTFYSLIQRNYRRQILVLQGAEISETTELSKIKIGGDKKHLKIGDNSFVGEVEIALHESVTIGNNVCINDGAILLTASHYVNDPKWQHKKAPIVLEDFVWIATNAIILPGVTIGKGAIVGAGSVVSKNVKPYSIVAGNPATELKKERNKDLNYNPCEFLAANLAWLKG